METGQSLHQKISCPQTDSLNPNSLRQMLINLDIGSLKVIQLRQLPALTVDR